MQLKAPGAQVTKKSYAHALGPQKNEKCKVLGTQNMGHNFITPKNEGNVGSHGVLFSCNVSQPYNFLKIIFLGYFGGVPQL